MPTEENLLRRTAQSVSPTKTSSDRDHRIHGSHRYIYELHLASPDQSTSKADGRKASPASWTGMKEQSIFRIIKEIKINR